MTPPRVPYHGPVVTGSQDQDNFVRDLITLLYPYGGWSYVAPPSNQKLSTSVAALPPVLTLDQIKAHCNIELDRTFDDELLRGMEMAARLNTQRLLRMDIDATCGENIKQAMYFLIAHYYRNREAVIVGTISSALPMGYLACLFPERDYSEGAYQLAARFEINAGDLDRRVSLLRPVYNTPEDEIPTYEQIAECSAGVLPQSGQETDEAGRTIALTSIVIVMRYRTDIDQRWRIRDRDKEFEVQTILDVMRRHVRLELTCQEVL